MYDYIIVGTGPCGLALSWYLSKLDKKILLIERENEIGGCHRVRRIDGLFSEHGPRIYLNNYVNFITILNEIGKSFDDVFTQYEFSMLNTSGGVIENLGLKELLHFAFGYMYFMVNPDYYKNITMLYFSKNFTNKAKDYIDRLCRMTDGAGIERYTAYEFFELINQNFLYNTYQPMLPTDVGLFKYWQEALLKTGKVDIMLGTNVIKINGDNEVKSILVSGNDGIRNLVAKKYILAIPPDPLMNLLSNSSNQIKNAFGNFNNIKQWKHKSRYLVYIPIIYHWNKKLDLPKIWGFPSTDWGVVFIVLSDYMKFDDPLSKTVITTAITMQDRISKNNGKTANQCTEEELKEEVYRQLKESFKNLERPTVSILSDGIYREGDKWDTIDTAFMLSTSGYLKDMKYNNLYNVGTHSGNSFYSFTAMESAVSNALYLALKLEPELKRNYVIKRGWTLNDVFVIFLIVIFIFIIINYLKLRKI